jgi:prepilin-type N-terminal cleavage/methylation domain-containing protein
MGYLEIRGFGDWEVWRFGDLGIWGLGYLGIGRFGDLGIGRFGDLEIWGFGDLEIWRFGYFGIGILGDLALYPVKNENIRKMRFNKKLIFNNDGVTLLELMVAVSLFSLTMIMATSVFQSVIGSQRDAIISQEMQENMRYSFEKLGKEIRTAQKDGAHSCIPSGKIFWTDGTRLEFLNYHNQCICYRLTGGRLEVSSNGCSGSFLPLTPQKIVISNLGFGVIDSTASIQALVTMKMHINVTLPGKANQNLDMQTTLSSRFYD